MPVLGRGHSPRRPFLSGFTHLAEPLAILHAGGFVFPGTRANLKVTAAGRV